MKRAFDFRTMVSGFLAAAVVFALSVGGATAAGLINGAKIRNHTIGVLKLKKTAVKSLRGQRGLRGLPGPAGPAGPQGPAGPAGLPGQSQPSTSAYARVTKSGTVMGAYSRNIAQTNVTRTASGQYCFRGLPLSIKTAVASPSGGGAIGAVVGPATVNCSFVVSTYGPGGKRFDNAFYVQFA
jgi:hypothetical protein